MIFKFGFFIFRMAFWIFPMAFLEEKSQNRFTDFFGKKTKKNVFGILVMGYIKNYVGF